ncbi:MAG TPA: GNAT family N-acetyltransferase [Thermomicrobiales bacterium]|jgi:GNAT superfamily N-acetyltransferase
MVQQFRIESIADHLDLIETIARWHWDEWGHADPGGSLATWTAGLQERTHRDRIPTKYVALDGDELLGSVTLVANDMASHPELTPWLAGTYVKPERRGQGVASALVRHAVQEAASMGVARLYLYTESARGLYERLGWTPLGEEEYEGTRVTIMTIMTHGGAHGRAPRARERMPR